MYSWKLRYVKWKLHWKSNSRSETTEEKQSVNLKKKNDQNWSVEVQKPKKNPYLHVIEVWKGGLGKRCRKTIWGKCNEKLNKPQAVSKKQKTIPSHNQTIKATNKGENFAKTETHYRQVSYNNKNDSRVLIRNNANQKKIETFLYRPFILYRMKVKKSWKPRNPTPSENVFQKILGKQKLREFITRRFSLYESTSGWKKRTPNGHSYYTKE